MNMVNKLESQNTNESSKEKTFFSIFKNTKSKDKKIKKDEIISQDDGLTFDEILDFDMMDDD